ncbi:MAG: IS66 family transposase [Rhodoferax sp.]|nr:IS66 family transposase [Rhodoferax sp.]
MFIPPDLTGLSPEAQAVAQQLLQHIGQQSKHIAQQGQQIESQAQAIQFKDANIERITFELRRLKAWRFDAKTERMNAEQRQLFEETLAADQADLEARLAALKAVAKETSNTAAPDTRPKPKRRALPEHLKRVDHHHEPQSTTCGCGQAMVRIGEDVSERLDIIPAQFFVHRHIRGKWACKCCQTLVQEPVEPHIIDKGMPTQGLVAHTLVSRFVDHIPYYRQEQINARSGVHTPRSTLASWSGQAGAALMPLYDAHRKFVLSCAVIHADETPVAMLDPGAGGTKRAYILAYARSGFDVSPGVVYDFCLGRGAKYPLEFLKGWSGTLVCDGYGGYDKVMAQETRNGAGCLAHARRKFDELVKDNLSPVGTQALQRIAALYQIERQAKGSSVEERLAIRQSSSKALCADLHEWLSLERQRVPEGSATAKSIDYSLNRWKALTAYLDNGAVQIDNNHIENLMRPWAMGRKAWLFAGSELAGQRAAVVMSLLQSAKLHGHDPWAYLKDVLTRLPGHMNSRIDELLPHRWQLGECPQRAGV